MFSCLLVRTEPVISREEKDTYLMIQEFLDMIDRQKMLAIHGNDNSIPDLRDQNLWLVLDFHVASRENFRIDTFRKSSKHVSPRRPNRDTEIKGSSDREDTIP